MRSLWVSTKFVMIAALITVFLAGKIYAQTEDTGVIQVTDVTWSNDGSKIATVGLQYGAIRGYIDITDLETGETVYHQEPAPGGFASVAWSPDDQFIAIGGYDQTIWVIDVQKREHIATLVGHQATVFTLDWNSDGTKLVSGGTTDQQAILWDMTTYQQLHAIQTGDVWAVAFSPDNQQIAVGGTGGLQIYPADLMVGNYLEQNRYRYYSQLNVTALAWGQDGQKISFGLGTFGVKASEVYVVDTKGNALYHFPTDQEAILGISWDILDKLIVTSSIDGLVKVWNSETGTLIESYLSTDIFPVKVNFSAYGGQLAYGTTIDTKFQPYNTEREIVGVEIVIPTPSVDRLNLIAQLCVAQSDTTLPQDNTLASGAVTALTKTDLPNFITQVQALPEGAIPAACAADLIAVAEAILAQP